MRPGEGIGNHRDDTGDLAMPNISPPSFQDHFSGHAAHYAASRPSYPDVMFADLAKLCTTRDCAWDCATGNGQAARSLAQHFDRVVATDASAEQIASARPQHNIDYRVAPAEAPGLGSGTIDLVTVAQALHWFDVERFFAAAKDVLRPGGVLAYWCYGFCSVESGCDEVTQSVYKFVDEFWPPERVIVEEGYRSIDVPLPTIEGGDYEMQVQWRAGQMLDYIHSWSACQRYERAKGRSPLDGFATTLRERWGDGARTVRWPLELTVCRAPATGAD